MDGDGAHEVCNPDHWIFEGTGVCTGDKFGGEQTILGYECDGCAYTMIDSRPVPTYEDGTPQSFEILAYGPAKLMECDAPCHIEAGIQDEGAGIMGMYQRNGTVFTAGTTDWSHGLGKDPIVDQITLNLFKRLS